MELSITTNKATMVSQASHKQVRHFGQREDT